MIPFFAQSDREKSEWSQHSLDFDPDMPRLAEHANLATFEFCRLDV